MTTRSARFRAASIRLRCPSWSAPIVGTSPIFSPRRLAGSSAARRSVTVRTTLSWRHDSPLPRSRVRARPAPRTAAAAREPSPRSRRGDARPFPRRRGRWGRSARPRRSRPNWRRVRRTSGESTSRAFSTPADVHQLRGRLLQGDQEVRGHRGCGVIRRATLLRDFERAHLEPLGELTGDHAGRRARRRDGARSAGQLGLAVWDRLQGVKREGLASGVGCGPTARPAPLRR